MEKNKGRARRGPIERSGLIESRCCAGSSLQRLNGLRRTGAAAVCAFVLGCLLLSACGGQKRETGAEDAELIVCSSHNEEIVRIIIAEFRERTGLRARFIQGGTGEMLARLRKDAEARAALAQRGAPAEAPVCDVMWGGGAESLAANADLFEPYFSPEAAAILPANKAADGSWTGFTLLPMAIGYNSVLLSKEKAPRSWADLLEPRFKGAIAYADPAVSASSYTILRTLGSALEKEGMTREQAERAFLENLNGKIMPESSTVFPAVASGEFLVGLYHDEGATELMLQGSDLRVVYPSDGTSAVPDGVALVRGSAHKAAAKRFIDFVLSADVARVMISRFHRRSARTDCPTPRGQTPLSGIKILDYNIAEAAAQKGATLARFNSIMRR